MAGIGIERLVKERLNLKEMRSPCQEKLLNLTQTVEFVRYAHDLGKTVVLTEGTWDLTHAGHISNIRESAKYASLVLMRLASAEYTQSFKGQGRSIEEHREIVVSEFEGVDAVFVDNTVISPEDIEINAAILAIIDPDIIALETEDERFQLKLDATNYAHDKLGSRIQPAVFTLPHIASTTTIINRILGMRKS